MIWYLRQLCLWSPPEGSNYSLEGERIKSGVMSIWDILKVPGLVCHVTWLWKLAWTPSMISTSPFCLIRKIRNRSGIDLTDTDRWPLASTDCPKCRPDSCEKILNISVLITSAHSTYHSPMAHGSNPKQTIRCYTVSCSKLVHWIKCEHGVTCQKQLAHLDRFWPSCNTVESSPFITTMPSGWT